MTTANELEEIYVKQFMKRQDIAKLLEDLPAPIQRKKLDEIFIEVNRLVVERGYRRACEKFLPGDLVLEVLALYGVTKKSIEKKIKYRQRKGGEGS